MKKKDKSKLKTAGMIFILLGLVLIAICLVFVLTSQKTKHDGESIKDDIIIDEDDRYVYLSEDFIKKLQKLFKNDNIVGYVVFKDAGISYPIVQGKDNEEYLRWDLYGRYSISGSIMLDYTRKSDFSSLNSVLYGHHMRDGSMFGRLEGSVKDLKKMSSVYVYTRTERIEYKGVSQEILDPDVDDVMYLFTEEKEDFYNYMSKVIYDGEINKEELEEEDSKYLTLVTCHYTGSRSRVLRYGLTCKYKDSKEYKIKEGK